MSTSHALLDLVEEITSSIDAKKISIGVFIDLKKAFDTVNHDLLIDKLEYYGISGIAREWLKSYLKDRKQFVQIDECASTLLSVTCAVPQGSILRPKLFILYINDTRCKYFDPCHARATVVRARFLAAAFSDGSYLAHVNGAYLRHVTFCIVRGPPLFIVSPICERGSRAAAHLTCRGTPASPILAVMK